MTYGLDPKIGNAISQAADDVRIAFSICLFREYWVADVNWGLMFVLHDMAHKGYLTQANRPLSTRCIPDGKWDPEQHECQRGTSGSISRKIERRIDTFAVVWLALRHE